MTLLKELMSTDVQVISPEMTIVDQNKRLVGILALGDFAVQSSEIRPAAQALSEISKP